MAFPTLDQYRSIEELTEHQKTLRSEITELNQQYDGIPFPDEARDEFAGKVAEDEEIDKRVAELTARKARLERFETRTENLEQTYTPPTVQRRQGAADIYRFDDLTGLGGARSVDTAIDRALRVAELSSPAVGDPEKGKARLQSLIRSDTSGELALRVIQTGSPTYDRAFGKIVMGRQLTPDESRALAISDANMPVPVSLDPTLLITNDGSTNPLRQIARVVQVTGNVWRGVATEGVTASYDDELAEVSDDTPTLTGPELNVEKAQAFVPFSIEAGEDWPGLRGELARAFADAKDTLEADKFMNGAGHGSHEPEGLLTGISATNKTATTGTYVDDDLFALTADLPERYQANATLLMSRPIVAITTLFSTLVNMNAPAFQNLIGYPVRTTSNIDSTVAAGNILAILGDFSRFVIVDRTGLNVELIPHLFGASRRPIGARALYAYWRNTSGVVDENAFRVLEVKS